MPQYRPTRLDRPCHHPGAALVTTWVRGESGRVKLVAIHVAGAGTVGLYESFDEARPVLAAYREPGATIRSVLEARRANGEDVSVLYELAGE